MSATLRSPDSARECSSMFLTIESARLPCWTTLPRLQRHQFRRLLLIRRSRADRIFKLIDELYRERGEVVDEVQRVLDLVRDAGGQLAKRGELLGLDQPLLRRPELLERFRQFPGAGLYVLEQACVLDSKNGL